MESHGVLTREHLFARAHAHVWGADFDVVLRRAVGSGRVRRLGGELYEAGSDPAGSRTVE